MKFVPFDEEYEIDKSVLTEDFPPYLLQSLRRWTETFFRKHSVLRSDTKKGLVLDEEGFLHPLQETFRRQFPRQEVMFLIEIFQDIRLARNVLSFILQNLASLSEGKKLEEILERCSSAYQVEFKEQNISIASGIKTKKTFMKLTYRVPEVVNLQAQAISTNNQLVNDAWVAHYGIEPDDEKTVTRCTDALAGLLRDKYFPGEKRTQLGTLLQKMRAKPEDYPLPADKLYDNGAFLGIMNDFSKIRGNHKTGTGRAPTYEEASFVLHYTIMLFQLLRNK